MYWQLWVIPRKCIGQWVVVGIKSLLQMEMCMCSLCLLNHLFQKDFHQSWIETWHFNILRCSGQNGILNSIAFSPVLSLCSLFLSNLVPYKNVTKEWEVCADGTVIKVMSCVFLFDILAYVLYSFSGFSCVCCWWNDCTSVTWVSERFFIAYLHTWHLAEHYDGLL